MGIGGSAVACYATFNPYANRLNNQIDTARLDDIAEGRSEGRGEMQREMALAMKMKGYSAQDISGVTGLTSDEIEGL